MNTSTLKTVRLTGPHALWIKMPQERAIPVWNVAVVASADGKAIGKTYSCRSYRRAAVLGCNMARDRNLILRVESWP